MQFNEDNKVIIDTMNEKEARVFLDFLSEERQRHYSAFEHGSNRCFIESGNTMAKFYDSASSRHLQDIHEIDTLSKKVKEKFGL